MWKVNKLETLFFLFLNRIKWRLLVIFSPSSYFFSRVIHGQISFFFIFTGPGVFFRKHHAIYHTYMCACHTVCVCTSAGMPGAHWLVCSGVKTVIKLSTCITRLNHHPAWLSVLLLAGPVNITHTHTESLGHQPGSTYTKHTVHLLTLNTNTHTRL